jgi:hypothetical protein
MREGASPDEPGAGSGDLVDENGVDRVQIREMLALTPLDRLRRMQEHVASILAIRELNEERPLR